MSNSSIIHFSDKSRDPKKLKGSLLQKQAAQLLNQELLLTDSSTQFESVSFYTKALPGALRNEK